MCKEGQGGTGPQPGRAQGSRSAAERMPRDPANQPRGPLPPAPALGLSTHKVRQLESAPSFYKARDWLEPSEEEVAAASDKRCFLFPAWESISDKRGEKIVPLALRVSPTQLQSPQKLPDFFHRRSCCVLQPHCLVLPCPGCPRKPLTPDLTATMQDAGTSQILLPRVVKCFLSPCPLGKFTALSAGPRASLWLPSHYPFGWVAPPVWLTAYKHSKGT